MRLSSPDGKKDGESGVISGVVKLNEASRVVPCAEGGSKRKY